MSTLTGARLDWAITTAAGAGFLLFGYGTIINYHCHGRVLMNRSDQGVMSGLLTGTAFTNQFPEIETTNGGGGSSSLQGTVVAIYEIGCFCGAILAFVFGERLGRRWTILLGCAIVSVGAAIQAAAYGIPQLITGRVVTGVGNGLNTATIREFVAIEDVQNSGRTNVDWCAAVWHSELMKPALRGRGLSIELAITIFGVMLSYWVGKTFLGYTKGHMP